MAENPFPILIKDGLELLPEDKETCINAPESEAEKECNEDDECPEIRPGTHRHGLLRAEVGDDDQDAPKATRSPRERVWSACVSTLVASLPASLIGFTIVYPSSALLVLMDDGKLPSSAFQFSTELSDAFGTMAPIGAIFGGPLGGWISDHWGRKCGLMFSSVPYLIGYLLLGYAHFSPTANLFKTLLLLGRFFSGIGMGWASTTSAVYIGEVSSASLRGLFGTIMQLNLTMGVLLCYALSISFPYYHIALAAVMIVTIYVMLGFWLKETPKWLLANSNPNIARQTLKWFRGPKYDVLGELEIMRKSLDEDNKTAAWREFKKKPVLVPFVTLLLVFFFQQIGGLNALGAYASVNFRYAGVSHPQLVSTLSLGVSAVVANIIASVIVDRMGRKPLLVISGIGMGIGSTLLGVHFYITRPSLCSEGGGSGFSGDVGDTTLEETGNGSCNEQYGPLAIVSILIYNSLFSIGWAAIPWVLLPELLPLKVRGIGGGFAILVNWATSALVTGAYLNYAEAISLWFAWWSFALLNFSAAAFAFFALVETKGKKLEAIQDAFKNKWKL